MAAVRTGLLALLALAATGLAQGDLAPGDALARGGAHPYFNDGGALRWYHSYAQARQAAEREGKLIFIESGRPNCGNCATLCKSVLASRGIRARMGRVAVGLVSNCDQMEPIVARLFRQNLYRPTILPLVGFVTPSGRWVTGFYGSRSISQFSADLDQASRTLRRINAPRAAPSAPVRPTPTRPLGTQPRPAQPRHQAPACPPVRIAPSDVAPRLPSPTHADCHDDSCPDGNCGIETCPGGDCPGGACSVDPQDPCAGFAAPLLPTDQPRPQASPLATAPATPRRVTARDEDLPAPRVRSVAGRPRSSRDLGMPRKASGSPDGSLRPRRVAPALPARPGDGTPIRPASTNVPIAKRKAQEAAARGHWGQVLRLTADIPELANYAEQSRRWARDTLETSVRLLLGRRLDPARKALEAVATEFEGFPAAIDAERGLEALGLVEELRYLSKDSIVRVSVRARAHERMRGSRWASLFRDAR